MDIPIDKKETVRGILTDNIIAPFYRGSIFEGNIGNFIRDTYGYRFDEASEQVVEYMEEYATQTAIAALERVKYQHGTIESASDPETLNHELITNMRVDQEIARLKG